MSRRERTSGEGADVGRPDWLRRGQPSRGRQWALEEQLLGPVPGTGSGDSARELANELAREQEGLERLQEDLRETLLRIARVERKLSQLRSIAAVDGNRAAPSPAPAPAPAPARRVVDPRPSQEALAREYWLCRCEGFQVDSPAGRVGVVEGLRFLSRLDQPDLLEVRGGLFGRVLSFIPVEDVEDVVAAERRLVIRQHDRPRNDFLHELLHLRLAQRAGRANGRVS